MEKVSKGIRYYIHDRMTNGAKPLANVTVIFSDGWAVGEGEHKIMDYIRTQRLEDGYDPDTTCVYGGRHR